MATELAYLLTGNTPDDTLLAAADQVAAGSLTMAAMLDQQAQRLLAAERHAQPVRGHGVHDRLAGARRLYTTAKDDTVFAMTDAHARRHGDARRAA